MDYGILSFGAYVPPIRLQRKAILDAIGWAVPGVRGLAAGNRAVANWDEDAITMAVEAGRDCLAGVEATVDHVSLASTNLPFADRSNSGVCADALGLGNAVLTEDLAGSRRAATSVLARAARAPLDTLLLASSCRDTRPGSTQEMTYGHGAGALLLGHGKPVAEFLSSASRHEDLVDQYRAADADYDYALEERWVREEGWFKIVPEVVEQAAGDAGIQVADIEHVVLHGSSSVARAMAKRLGIEGARFADALAGDCGDCGSAHPLMMLSAVLADAAPDQYVLVVGFGQGADAIILRTTPALMAMKNGRGVKRFLPLRRETDNYTYFLSLRNRIDIDFGLRSERDNRTALSAYYRRRHDITSMMGGRCTACNTLQFPRALICVKCGAEDSQTPESLSGLTGRVKSFTEDWLAYTPSPPYIYGNVEFPDGANIMLEFTDFAAGEVKVGDPVRMVFRVKDFDHKRNFRRYFWKPAPLPAQEGN